MYHNTYTQDKGVSWASQIIDNSDAIGTAIDVVNENLVYVAQAEWEGAAAPDVLQFYKPDSISPKVISTIGGQWSSMDVLDTNNNVTYASYIDPTNPSNLQIWLRR